MYVVTGLVPCFSSCICLLQLSCIFLKAYVLLNAMRKSASVNLLTYAGVASSTSSRNGVAQANADPVRCPSHSLSMSSVSVSSLVLMRSLIQFLKSFEFSFPEKVILFPWSLFICPQSCAIVTPAAGCCGAAPPAPAMFI